MRSSGGAVCLTEENPSAFKKWMIAESEEACLLKEFEQEYISEKAINNNTMKKECLHKRYSNSKHWLWCIPSVG